MTVEKKRYFPGRYGRVIRDCRNCKHCILLVESDTIKERGNRDYVMKCYQLNRDRWPRQKSRNVLPCRKFELDISKNCSLDEILGLPV